MGDLGCPRDRRDLSAREALAARITAQCSFQAMSRDAPNGPVEAGQSSPARPEGTAWHHHVYDGY